MFCSALVRYKFYMWSNRVMREVVRYRWKTAQGRINKRVHMIVTPAVQVVRPSLCFRYMYHKTIVTSLHRISCIILSRFNILFLYTQKILTILLWVYQVPLHCFECIHIDWFYKLFKREILVAEFKKKENLSYFPFLM